MIYSPRAQPEVNESHIHEVPKNNGLIFHMGEVSELWHKTMGKHVFLRCLKVEASLSEPEIEKAIVQARVPESSGRVCQCF